MTTPLPPNLPPHIAQHTLDFQSRLNQPSLPITFGTVGQPQQPGLQGPQPQVGHGAKIVLVTLLLLFAGFFLLFKVVLPLIGLSIIWQAFFAGF